MERVVEIFKGSNYTRSIFSMQGESNFIDLRAKQRTKYSRLVGRIIFFFFSIFRVFILERRNNFVIKRRRKTSYCFSVAYLFPFLSRGYIVQFTPHLRHILCVGNTLMNILQIKIYFIYF